MLESFSSAKIPTSVPLCLRRYVIVHTKALLINPLSVKIFIFYIRISDWSRVKGNIAESPGSAPSAPCFDLVSQATVIYISNVFQFVQFSYMLKNRPKAAGLPYRIDAANTGTFLLNRREMTLAGIQKFALLIRELGIYQNTGPSLPADLLSELNGIIGTFTDPSLTEQSHLEHELYLGVRSFYGIFQKLFCKLFHP